MHAPDTRSNAARIPQVEERAAARLNRQESSLPFASLLRLLPQPPLLAGSHRPNQEERAERVCEDKREDPQGGWKGRKRACRACCLRELSEQRASRWRTHDQLHQRRSVHRASCVRGQAKLAQSPPLLRTSVSEAEKEQETVDRTP